MPDILIAENIRGAAVDELSRRFSVVSRPELWKSPAELMACVGEFRALIVRNQTQVKRDLLMAAKKMVVIGRAGVGLDNIDVASATEAGILVTSTPDQNAISVAELAMGMMLALARMIPAASADTKNGNWNRQTFLGTELYGKTFGIVGAGKIGYLTARRAQAFGMRVVAYDPFISRDNVLLSELNADLVSLEELLTRADVVSCHLPSTPETAKLLNAEAFAKMKPTATFINTSRGEVVAEDDLLAALKAGTIAGAALDVRATEPPVPGELETVPNLILMPHVAAFTHEAQARVTRAICEDVARVLDGLSPQNAVNWVP
jgi:D-3-phosphoglycerate dehydrogenase